MQYALVQGNFVVNIIEADEAFAATLRDDWQYVVPVENASIGWAWNGETAIAPPETVQPARVCTRRQGRLALLHAGKLLEVEAIINNIANEEDRIKAQIEYESDTWERDNEFLITMWAGMGGTSAQLDDLFALAVSQYPGY